MKLIESHYYLEVKQTFLTNSEVEYRLLDVTDINKLYKPISINDDSMFCIIRRSEEAEYKLMQKLIETNNICTTFSMEQCVILDYNGYKLYMEIYPDIYSDILIMKQFKFKLADGFKIDVPSNTELLAEKYANIQKKLNMIGKSYTNAAIYGDELMINIDWESRRYLAVIKKLISVADRTRVTVHKLSMLNSIVDIGNIVDLSLDDIDTNNIDKITLPSKEICILNTNLAEELDCNKLEVNTNTWINVDINHIKSSLYINSIEGSRNIKCLKAINILFKNKLESLDLRGIENDKMFRNISLENIKYLILSKHTLNTDTNSVLRSVKLVDVDIVLSSNTDIDTVIFDKEELVYYNKDYENDIIEFRELQLDKKYNRVATHEEREKFQL